MISDFFKWEGSVAVVTIFIVLILVTVFTCLIRNSLKDYKRLKEGPYADATIISATKVRDMNRSGVRYSYNCDLVYKTYDGQEYQSFLSLPYESFEVVPVGSKVKIAYNPRKPKKVIFVQALFMSSPEYVAAMEAKGYTYTGDAFVRNSSDCSQEEKNSCGITMRRKDS